MTASTTSDGRTARRRAGAPTGRAATDPRSAVRITLRPLAGPLPLGLFGLGGGTISLAGLQLGWLPVALSHQVAVVVLLTAVPLQLLASVIGFLGRDAVAATGMGTLAASWASIGVLMLLGAPGTRSPVLGLVLCYLAVAVAVSAVVAALGKGVVAAVLAVAAGRFAATGVYELTGLAGWQITAGWIGVALCAMAVYAALASEVEEMRSRTVLPTLRHGAGRRALDGEGLSTIGPVQREPGVREQL